MGAYIRTVLLRLVGASLASACISPAVAQLLGDINGDGFVTSADAQSVPTCMTGPLGSVVTDCQSLDFGFRARVDLQSVLALQASQTGSGCVSWEEIAIDGRGYAGVVTQSPLPNDGVECEFRARAQPVLCPSGAATAFSAQWIGPVVYDPTAPDPNKRFFWAQMGIDTHRNDARDPQPVGLTVRRYYYEVTSGNPSIPSLYRLVFLPATPVVSTENVTLTVRRASPTSWFFSCVDEFGLPVFTPVVTPSVGNWSGVVTDEIQVMCETLNTLDRIAGPGGIGGRVSFYNLRYFLPGGGLAQPLEFEAGSDPSPYVNSLPDFYVTVLFAPDFFEVWDNRP
jgi:hypothetical protein